MLEPPPAAVLVEAFANTVDLDLGTDDLAAPEQVSAFLAAHGLLDAGTPVTPGEHDRALRLRAGLREALGANVGDTPDPGAVAAADEVLRGLPLLVAVGGDGPVLSPGPGLAPAEAALARIALAWSALVTTGDAARLKRCAEHSCGWVFWDVSKNRSRRWCSMRVCGNRNKARAYAARQR
ncbi:CGNR zinc finger domain-containing protein [Streptomyces sp. NPDC008238]